MRDEEKEKGEPRSKRRHRVRGKAEKGSGSEGREACLCHTPKHEGRMWADGEKGEGPCLCSGEPDQSPSLRGPPIAAPNPTISQGNTTMSQREQSAPLLSCVNLKHSHPSLALAVNKLTLTPLTTHKRQERDPHSLTLTAKAFSEQGTTGQ